MPEATSPGHADRVAPPDNDGIAARLREFADLIEPQSDNAFRVRAYREAAQTLATLDRPIAAIFKTGGIEALDALPTIGPSIGAAIAEMLVTGGWRQLERMRGDLTAERLFSSLPGVGPTLAARFADRPDCETLEDLERVLSDPASVIEGIGPRRRAGLLAVLRERLTRLRRVGVHPAEPDVATLLDADRLYRERAMAGGLRMIAPRRFNPDGRAWLPVIHATRGPWHVTALYSNSALAHRLDRCKDWVVLYFHRDAESENRRTVVTETRGPLTGRRVVRGREDECLAHYGAGADPEPEPATTGTQA